jgi:hypothetical protein
MKRRVFLLAFGLLVMTAVGLFALDVIKPGQGSPAAYVLARKAAMATNISNFIDMSAKLTAGDIKGIAADANSMAVIMALVPAAFGDVYLDAYPVGSAYFFKGGPSADFLAKAQALVTAAENIATLADNEDRAGVEAQLAGLDGLCTACHVGYRGQN